MKKSAQKTQEPPTLGTKRSCPKCATKFYDFGKEELTCPKCASKFNVSDLSTLPRAVAELKRPSKAAEKIVEDPLLATDEPAAESDAIESVDDLADDGDGVEDIDVDEDEQESY